MTNTFLSESSHAATKLFVKRSNLLGQMLLNLALLTDVIELSTHRSEERRIDRIELQVVGPRRIMRGNKSYHRFQGQLKEVLDR